MKGHLFSILAMASMFSSGAEASNKFKNPYIPPSKPIPFTFKRFKHTQDKEIPKGCKLNRLQFVFIKSDTTIIPNIEYKITIAVDIIYGTKKSAMKKIIQYKNEIGYFMLHTTFKDIYKHKEDILIERIKSE